MAESKITPSGKSLVAATKSRAEFSGYGQAKGAGGYDVEYVMRSECDTLMKSGDSISVNPPESGFGKIEVGAAWDNIKGRSQNPLGRLFGMKKKMNVDLDLGCLYELSDGRRGAVQAFGDLFGAWDEPPYITLSGDERTGDKQGDDEIISINGHKWDQIHKVLFYVYIYEGVADWAEVRPEIHIRIPDRPPLIVTLAATDEDLDLCMIAGIERVRSGMRVTNFTQYFPGHSEMDRAYGFGLNWSGGRKRG